MTAIQIHRDPFTGSLRAHVFDRRHPRATHVFDAVHALADRPTLRYTLAGFPSGNLRAGRCAPCA